MKFTDMRVKTTLVPGFALLAAIVLLVSALSIDQGTQQNAALVEQSAAAAETLKRQVAGLLRLVAAFKTSELRHSIA